MKKVKTILILAGFSFFACNSTTQQDKSTDVQGEHSSEMNHQEEHNTTESARLKLDNGKKWLLDEPTRIHASNMEQLVSTDGSLNADMKYYSTLAGALKENIAKLTSDCSMTGESHEQLHVWLIPYIEKVKTFSMQKNPEGAANELKEIRASLEEFRTYFE